jgi:hypothetical protein
MMTQTLWRTPGHDRHFITPDNAPQAPGSLALISIGGDEASFDPDWAARYEVSEHEAREWAREEAGIALGAMRRAVAAKLAAMSAALEEQRHALAAPGSAHTPDAVPAVFALLRKLPRAVLDAVSGEDPRVVSANAALGEAEGRLKAAGIDTDGKLGQFAFRLAALRREFEMARKG